MSETPRPYPTPDAMLRELRTMQPDSSPPPAPKRGAVETWVPAESEDETCKACGMDPLDRRGEGEVCLVCAAPPAPPAPAPASEPMPGNDDLCWCGVRRELHREYGGGHPFAMEHPRADTMSAPGELDASTLESYAHIARRLVEYRDAKPFDAHAYVTAKLAYEATFGIYSDAPQRVAQLVAAARETERLREALKVATTPDVIGNDDGIGYSEDDFDGILDGYSAGAVVEVWANKQLGQRWATRVPVSFDDEGDPDEDEFRLFDTPAEAHAAIAAARASRPTEETDG
jgi:hypothetical protein